MTASSSPLISIVIPTMNSAALIAQALDSLVDQTWRDFEVVVSDGDSSDDTIALAEGFADRLPALRVESRRDSGVYDAINRGVRLSRGRWFIVLGSDDRLHDASTLAVVARHLEAAGDAQMVYGDVRMMAVNQCGVAPGERYAGPMPLKRLFGANVCQQAIFYKRTLFDALGGFDLRFRLYADWDFNLRAAFHAPTRWIDVVIADYAATGMSATRSDAAFMAALPGMIRTELLRRADDRASWPLQRHLLRLAKQYRRAGQWRESFEYQKTYLALLARRLAVRLQRVG